MTENQLKANSEDSMAQLNYLKVDFCPFFVDGTGIDKWGTDLNY